MKTNLEILQMIKNLIEQADPSSAQLSRGLCNITFHMRYQICVINEQEKAQIDAYISNNRPLCSFGSIYWYDQGDMRPRLNWVNQHIKRLT